MGALAGSLPDVFDRWIRLEESLIGIALDAMLGLVG